MSCGSGYLSGNMLVEYPFEDGQCWVGADAQVALQRCFVDACIYVQSDQVDEWPSLGKFEPGTDSISFSIAARGAEVRLSVSASLVEFPIVSGSAPWGTYVISLSSDGIRRFCAFCAENGISTSTPDSDLSSSSGRDVDMWMRLCARCVYMMQGGVRSISVYDGVHSRESGPHFTLEGAVSVVPGNNVLLSAPDGEENGFQIGAVPGAGLGKVACACEESADKGSTLDSPDGHVRIFNDMCYDLEPGPIGTVLVDGETRVSRKLLVHSKCTACCTCEMYESIVNDRLVDLSDKIRSAKSSISRMLREYESGVREFNRRIAIPSADDVKMTMTGMPIGRRLSPRMSGTGIKGKLSRCSFTAVVRNSSYAVVDVNIVALDATGSIVETTASWSDQSGNPLSHTSDSTAGILGSTFRLYQGMSLVVTFIAVNPALVSVVQGVSYTGSMTVSLSYITPAGSSGSLGVIRRSVEVKRVS